MLLFLYWRCSHKAQAGFGQGTTKIPQVTQGGSMSIPLYISLLESYSSFLRLCRSHLIL